MDTYPTASVIQPIVYHDSSVEDTFASIASSLNALIQTTDAVFGRINTRIMAEQARLNALNIRMQRCNDKINLISHSTKAVTIYAGPKFPAADVARHSKLLCLHNGIDFPAPSVDDGSGLAPIGANLQSLETLDPADQVVTRPEKRGALLNVLAEASLLSSKSDDTSTSLGVLPDYLPSVCSTLIFSTRERPYTAQKTLSDLITEDDDGAASRLLSGARKNLNAARNAAAAARDAQLKALGTAPKTFSEGDNLPAFAAVEYIYKPKLRDIEQFALPTNLALPNLADISWQASLGTIAPSAAHNDEVKLPTLLDLQPPKPNMPPAPAPTTAAAPTNVTPISAPEQSNLANSLPDLPPAPVAAPVASLPTPAPSNVSMNLPDLPPAPGVELPPAPPTLHIPDSTPASAPPMSPSVDSGRFNLLSALNNPENALRLKKVKKDDGDGVSSGRNDDEPPAKPAKAPAPVSMMDEMANRLAMRRKAMSGDTNSSKPSAPPPLAAPKPSNPGLPSLGSPTEATPSEGGLFRPEAMHGFKISAAKSKKAKRKDSDDWGSDSDSD